MANELKIPTHEALVPNLYAQVEGILLATCERIKSLLHEAIPGLKDGPPKPIDMEGLTNLMLNFNLDGKDLTLFISLEEQEMGLYWDGLETQVATLEEIPDAIKEERANGRTDKGNP